MAAPIAHIFLAVQMLNGPLAHKFNQKEFILGTSFPDIRYLKCVERAETHFPNVTLNDIKKETNSFKAGMLLHSFVDEQREAYIVKHNLYDKIPSFKFTTQTLKFAEDQILLKLFAVQQYKHYFDTILPEEQSYGIANKHLKNWHFFLQEYFEGKFSTHDVMMRYFDLNEPQAWRIKRLFFSWFYACKIDKTIVNILKDTAATKILLDFYTHFSQWNS